MGGFLSHEGGLTFVKKSCFFIEGFPKLLKNFFTLQTLQTQIEPKTLTVDNSFYCSNAILRLIYKAIRFKLIII